MASVKETAKTAAPTVSYNTDKELYATRYKQGGRTVFSVAMTPAQIAATVKKPDPDASNPGNRKIKLKHAQEFAGYFIDYDSWVAPGIILRAPNIFKFHGDNEVADVQFGVMSYAERNQGDIHILDGQHRILGFHIAIEVIDDLLDKARSQKASARRQERSADTPAEAPAGPLEREANSEILRLEKVRDRLYGERVSVEIQVTDDLDAYRQMFYDIAENAVGITASVKARFDQRKVVNRALNPALEHPLLAGRVEMETDRLPRTSPSLMTAKHVVEIMRVANLGFDGRFGRRHEREMKEATVAKVATTFFTMLTRSFPPMKALELGQVLPENLRETSLLGSPLFLRILAGVYYDLTVKHSWSMEQAAEFFAKLAPHVNAPAHANSIWQKHGPEGAYKMGAISPVGRRQDSRALVDAMVEWALDTPSFLTAEPEPAPVVEEPQLSDEEVLATFEKDPSKEKLTGAAAEMALEQDKIAKESKARGRARSTAKKK